MQATQRKNFEALNKMLARDKELDILYEKVFEEKTLGHLSEERFLKLSGKYEEEQFELKAKIKNMKKTLDIHCGLEYIGTRRAYKIVERVFHLSTTFAILQMSLYQTFIQPLLAVCHSPVQAILRRLAPSEIMR